jgi:tripartite-type tricarboxylate transporter receptor subunit TctC
MNQTARLAAISLTCIAVVGPGPSRAQDPYPAKPVRLVVPFPPGGGADNIARIIMPAAMQALGQQIVIENRPGAGGNVGAEAVAKSAPDGYTVLYGTNGTHGINHGLYARTGFDPIKDFAPIGRLTRIAAVLVVHRSVPASSVKDLIAHLKANPGKVTFASAGNGTTSHIAGEIFKSATGVDIVHVPYKGNGPATIDLISGQVSMMIDVMPSAYPHAKAGKIRALAVTSLAPVPGAPELPTMDAAGVPGFDVTAWDGLFAPAGTPRAAIDRLNDAFRRALADPQVSERLIGRGAEPIPGPPEALAKHVAAELPKWADAVKRSGAKVD